ncbi:MAG TPA: chloramphenicol acetyltransferase [Anaerolineaceae bacterium]|nr:chloramphenicol acetyltransferase [Anaerolineaceae bacterium]HPN52442.1 chloramphenicol acetyltransferase [Anaerolineaceae bacterium]
MQTIDMQTWPRRQHFEKFNAFDYPQFNLCANVDITAWTAWIKPLKIPLTMSFVYLIARAANEIPEFRTRIHGQEVVVHELVHPSTTVLADNDTFSFCTIPFAEPFSAFAVQAAERVAAAKKQPALDDGGRDDLLFLSSIPWVSFTGLVHPIHMHPVDSVPRISWGKFFADGENWKMPLSVQVHHALMDGLHVGRYYKLVQDYLNAPEELLS